VSRACVRQRPGEAGGLTSHRAMCSTAPAYPKKAKIWAITAIGGRIKHIFSSVSRALSCFPLFLGDTTHRHALGNGEQRIGD
jgi:hypothetical protein